MIIRNIESFKVSYDTVTNKGIIADNGFSVEFSLNFWKGIISDEPLDKNLASSLYNSLYKEALSLRQNMFEEKEWKKRIKRSHYYTIAFNDFMLKCFTDANVGTLLHYANKETINRFIIDYYNNMIWDNELFIEIEKEIKETFLCCKEDRVTRTEENKIHFGEESEGML